LKSVGGIRQSVSWDCREVQLIEQLRIFFFVCFSLPKGKRVSHVIFCSC
jgi:hypothetical protein